MLSSSSAYVQFPKRITQKSQLEAFDSTVSSIMAGSIAGVIGIGTAYPLDSLKTKAQTYSLRSTNKSSTKDKYNTDTQSTKRSLSMIDMAKLVLVEDGLAGFYGGVYGVMSGEAFVKATLFGSNVFALSILTRMGNDIDHNSPTFIQLCLASAFAGFVSSFVLNPIERVKILMQADKAGTYSSEWDCIQKIINQDGISGLLFRGLDGMMAREIPGCVVYFVAYSLLVNSIISSWLGSDITPFICGGAAGVLAWIPIYPSDVIKT